MLSQNPIQIRSAFPLLELMTYNNSKHFLLIRLGRLEMIRWRGLWAAYNGPLGVSFFRSTP